jgi:hypothetical protein
MSEINTNTPVTEVQTSSSDSGKVEMDAGGGALTFDELDSVLNSKKNSKKAAKDDESKTEKSKDLTSDTDKGKKPEPKKSDAVKKPTEEIKDGQSAEAKDEQKRKTVKAKYAEDELELDEETLIPVSVNGKEEMWTLKELRADKAGKTAWDKQFTELHKMRKETTTQNMKMQEISNNIKQVFEEKDPNIKMFKMAKLAGVDPIQFREQFLNDNISLLEKWYGMTEDERKADAASFEAQYHKHRADTLESSSKNEHAHRELSSKIDGLRASHQVSEDEFVTRYDEITDLVKSGSLGKNQLTPEFVIETINKDRMWNAAAQKLDSLNLGLDPQARGKQLMKLVETSFQIGLKPQDMAEIVDELWGSKKAQRKIEDKKKSNEEFLHGKREVTQVKPKSSEATFFDEM